MNDTHDTDKMLFLMGSRMTQGRQGGGAADKLCMKSVAANERLILHHYMSSQDWQLYQAIAVCRQGRLTS